MATDYATREAAYTARKEQLHAMAPYVCALLGEGWAVVPPKHPAVEGQGFLHNYVDLSGPDGAQLCLSAGYAYDTKGSISAQFTDRLDGYQFWYLPHGVSRPSIGVNLSRGAKAVASEIKRRILPDYLPLLKACNSARESHIAHVASGRAVCEELSAIMKGGEVRSDNHSGQFKVYPYHSPALRGASFDIKVSGAWVGENRVGEPYHRAAEVTFDRLCVSPLVAEQILAVLVRNHKPEQE